ncbi:hypothetical protein ACFFX1_49010 [Dactylosporangium sucinum]|uniref:hypothetical protein n=1 Tax=Dactylosporangium sucinum TaxID=1424081 RepID=UPI00167D576A|nr:hypothetical protein [Dactylosporangium sucinum]
MGTIMAREPGRAADLAAPGVSLPPARTAMVVDARHFRNIGLTTLSERWMRPGILDQWNDLVAGTARPFH